MATPSETLREAVARRASDLTGVDVAAILAELAPDGRSHHATSTQVGAAIDQAITELAHE